ncbi:MAG: hypothetical protein ACTSRA_22390, partial [Promethearchaeota archaeon]
DENLKAQEAITNSAGALNHAFEIASGTLRFKFNQFVTRAKTLMIEFGEAIGAKLIPMLNNMIKSLRSTVDWFNDLSDAQQKNIVRFTMLAAALGPVIIAFNILRSSVIVPLIAVFKTFSKWIDIAIVKLTLMRKVGVGVGTALQVGFFSLQKTFTSLISTIGAFLAKFAIMAGIGAIIAILGTALVGWIKKLRDVDELQKQLNKTNEDARRIYYKETAVLDKLAKTAKDEYTTKDMRAQAVRRLNELAPEYLRNLTEENVTTEKGIKLIDDYKAALDRKAKAQAALNVIAEIEKKRIEDLATGMNKQLTFWELANKMGVVYAATGTSHIIPYINKRKNAEKVARLEQEKAIKTAKECEEAIKKVTKIFNENTFALDDVQAKYGLIADEVKNTKDATEDYAKSQMRSIKDLIKHIKEYIAFLGAAPDIELWDVDRANTVLYTLVKALKGLEKFYKDWEKAAEEAAKKAKAQLKTEEIQKFWEDYEKALRTAAKLNEWFGDSYDLLGEQLEIHYSRLLAIANDETLATEEKKKELLRYYTTVKLTIDAIERLGKEEKQITDVWEAQQEVLLENNNKYEDLIQKMMAAEAMLQTWRFSQKGLTNDLYDSNEALEQFKKIVDDLWERRFELDTDDLEKLRKLLEGLSGWSMVSIKMEMGTDLETVTDQAKYLGDTFKESEAKLQIFRSAYRRLLSVTPEAWATMTDEMKQNWADMVNDM